MTKEPSAVISALGAFLASLAKMAVLLDIVQWDADQLAGVSLVIDSLIILLGAVFIRSQVTPVSSPSLPAGTDVRLPDGGAGEVVRK